jgi:hypothetical protein
MTRAAILHLEVACRVEVMRLAHRDHARESIVWRVRAAVGRDELDARGDRAPAGVDDAPAHAAGGYGGAALGDVDAPPGRNRPASGRRDEQRHRPAAVRDERQRGAVRRRRRRELAHRIVREDDRIPAVGRHDRDVVRSHLVRIEDEARPSGVHSGRIRYSDSS